MLQLNPNARLSLADCVGHAWMQGPIASAEQVRKEFAKRADAIKKQKEEEAEQAAKQRAQVDPKRKAAVRAIKGEVENGPLDQFNAEDVLAQDTVLFSTYEPKDLIDMFQGELINKDIKHEQKKWKIHFDILREPSDEEIKDANEGQPALEAQGARVKFKIMKVDEKKYAMEFSRLSGDSMVFREQLIWMKACLAEYCDATQH